MGGIHRSRVTEDNHLKITDLPLPRTTGPLHHRAILLHRAMLLHTSTRKSSTTIEIKLSILNFRTVPKVSLAGIHLNKRRLRNLAMGTINHRQDLTVEDINRYT